MPPLAALVRLRVVPRLSSSPGALRAVPPSVFGAFPPAHGALFFFSRGGGSAQVLGDDVPQVGNDVQFPGESVSQISDDMLD